MEDEAKNSGGVAVDSLESQANRSKEHREAVTEAWNKSQQYWNALITVCDSCLQASCWQGIFYCDNYKTAGTTQKSRLELKALGREHESYWTTDDGF